MMILIHVVLGFAILMGGSDFASMDGGMARKLALPGSEIIPFIPWLAVGVYALVVILTRRNPKRWIRIGGILAGYALAGMMVSYPNWLFERSSRKLGISEFLSPSVVTNFQQRFSTLTVQYSSSSGGPWLVVPRRNYSDSMVLFLKDQEKRPTEPIGSTNAASSRR